MQRIFKNKIYIRCSKCGKPLYEEQFDGQQLADNYIYNSKGELKYIELAHSKCKPQWIGDG
jgi:hypothetical protein